MGFPDETQTSRKRNETNRRREIEGSALNNHQSFLKPPAQGWASRKGSFVHIVPLDPASKAGLTGHVPAKSCDQTLSSDSRHFNGRNNSLFLIRQKRHFLKK